MNMQLRISESVNFDYMKRFKDHMSSVVTWIQEGQIPSRRADMLRTLHVSNSALTIDSKIATHMRTYTCAHTHTHAHTCMQYYT